MVTEAQICGGFPIQVGANYIFSSVKLSLGIRSAHLSLAGLGLGSTKVGFVLSLYIDYPA